ncbi:N-acetyltransferase family protein [Streptomyces sp. TR06-5]|uniref:GNAT family N-acetyltransferase n=1 Tax=unclassified Streptomyces TaxID=2593676 RepID=UPI0039A3E81D
MTVPFTVRPAQPADEAQLAALSHRTWSPEHAVTPRPESPEAPFFRSAGPEACLVAEVPGRGVVGYVRLVRADLPSNAHVRMIQGLEVDEGVRGSGIGRALVEAACERARGQGARRVTLRVLGHNRAARALYASLGFRTEGTLPEEFLLDGRYADDVLMGRSLV